MHMASSRQAKPGTASAGLSGRAGRAPGSSPRAAGGRSPGIDASADDALYGALAALERALLKEVVGSASAGRKDATAAPSPQAVTARSPFPLPAGAASSPRKAGRTSSGPTTAVVPAAGSFSKPGAFDPYREWQRVPSGGERASTAAARLKMPTTLREANASSGLVPRKQHHDAEVARVSKCLAAASEGLCQALQALTAGCASDSPTPIREGSEDKGESPLLSPSASEHYRLGEELAGLQGAIEELQAQLEVAKDQERKLKKAEAKLKREVKEVELKRKLQAIEDRAAGILLPDEELAAAEEREVVGAAESDAVLRALLEVVADRYDSIFPAVPKSEWTDNMRLVANAVEEQAIRGGSTRNQMSARHWQLVRPAAA
eukprot:TRINITY_DN102057_c0_g1_i1.p1 TRINITY_DN102057_c0_g1~~TRINITY_DN102057_c0_g1_i1.p1  ORF type:complete len:376 (-),score=80.94 TRINITY_DN102057_c0_g1_i1:70-1197(-)